jgi:EAL domain-containing protein (putative c-di-GMP-specific phosphodiesterase class I)
LYFQPQAKASGEVFGFEVLLRWRHPRGMVSPARFIPLAEETGAIGPIDEWVLREVCREAASWPKPLSIAVNLSPVDFRRADVPAMILSILLETGDPQQTFIAKIGNSFQAAAIIHAILGLGRALALPVIAEGVETEEQLAFLASEGCEIQGYLIGRPQPIAHYRHLVAGAAPAREDAAIAG